MIPHVDSWLERRKFLPAIESVPAILTERENRLQEASASIDARNNGGKLRKLAQTEATSVMLTLLKDAKAAEIPAKYVLFDTWFCSSPSLLQVKDIGYDVIVMVKKSDKIHFRYNGRMESAPAIF